MFRVGDRPTLALALALALLGLCACQTKPTARRAKKTKTQVVAVPGSSSAARPQSPTAASVAASAPQAASSAMAAAFVAVAHGCEVSLAGRVTKASCRSSDATTRLVAAETQLGSTTALLHYCAALGGDDHVARALASQRVDDLAGTAKRAAKVANRRVFDCFVELLPRLSADYLSRHARRVAQAIGWFAVALGPEATARAERALLAHSNAQARRDGQQAMWKHSVPAALRALRAAMAAEDSKLAGVITTALVDLTPYEAGLSRKTSAGRANRAQMCPLLGKLLARRDKSVTAYAARALVKHCGAGYHASIIAAARAAIQKPHHFSWYFSFALRDLASAKKNMERDPARVRSVAATLVLAVESKTLDSYGRKYALEVLFDVDKKRALALARRYARAGCDPDVSEMACKLINKAKP